MSTSAQAYLPRPKSPLPRLAQAQELSEVVHKVSAKEPVNEPIDVPLIEHASMTLAKDGRYHGSQNAHRAPGG